MMDKITENALDLICEIRSQIESDCEDEIEFLERAREALEDGEFLDSYFYGVGNKLNGAITEKAYEMVSERLNLFNQE